MLGGSGERRAGGLPERQIFGCREREQAGAGLPQPTPAAPQPSPTDRLVERVLNDVTAAWVMGAVYIGDRLGLFKAMRGAGEIDAHQLAAKTNLGERYVAEWLRTLATSGYVDCHPAAWTFELAPEQAVVLVDEDSPAFLAGLCVPDTLMTPRVMEAFRTGEGIPYGDYPAETFDSIERCRLLSAGILRCRRWSLPSTS